MRRKAAWKRVAAWAMTAVMLTGNSSFAALAQEMDEMPLQEIAVEAAVQEAAVDAPVAEMQEAVSEIQETVPEPAEETAAEEPEVLVEQIVEEVQAGEEIPIALEDAAEQDAAEEESTSEADLPAEDEEQIISAEEYAEEILLNEAPAAQETDPADGTEGEKTEDYSVWFDGLREDGWTWNYVDGDIVYPLNKDNLAGLEGLESFDPSQLSYVYEYGYWDEENGCIVPITTNLEQYLTADGISIPASVVPTVREEIVEASGDSTDWLEVAVSVQYQGNEISGNGTSIQLRTPFYEYNYPQIRRGELLPGWNEYLDSDFECWVEDAAHPEGENVTVHIDRIEVADMEDSENVLDYSWNGENGWDFHANHYGGAKVTIFYTPVAGSGDSGEYSFDVWVGDRATDLDIDTPNHMNMVLPGQEIELGAFMTRYNDEGEMEFLPGDLDGCLRLEWGIGWGEENVESFAPDKNEPRIFRVQTAEREDDYEFMVWVRAYETDENGEEFECGYADYVVNAFHGYYVIEPSDLERTDLHIGESVTVRPELWQYEINGEGTEGTSHVVEEFQEEDGTYPAAVRWEYDEAVVEITENEDGSYTITKLQNVDTDIRLRFGIERTDDQGGIRFEERCQRSYYLDEMDYSVWFDDLKEDGQTWNYVDEAVSYTLNKENLAGLESLDSDQLKFVYEYGYWDEENGCIVPITTNLEQYLTADGISIPASEVSTVREEIVKASGDRTDWLEVAVSVQYQGNEISGTGISIQLRNTVYEYNYPQIRRGELLPGWNEYLDSDFECWVEDAAHPDGEDVTVHINEIKVADMEGSENVLEYSWNGENGWNFHANNHGGATVTISYTPVAGSGDSGAYSFDVWVGNRVTDLDIDTPNHMNMVLPGQEIELGAFMTRYNDEGEMEFLPGNLDGCLRLEWGIGWGEENVESSAPDKNEPRIFRVQTAEREDDYEFMVWVRAYETDENDQEFECGYADYVVNARHDYFVIEPSDLFLDNDAESPVNPLIQESLYIVGFDPTLWYYRVGEEPRQWDEVRYHLEYDEDAWSISEDSEVVEEPVLAEELPELVRKTTWGTDINLLAFINVAEEGEAEDWQEVARRSYHFDDITDCYQADFIYSYGERMDEPKEGEPIVSRVLTDIPLVLSLDTAGLHGVENLEGCTVEWNFWQYNDETETGEDATCATWEIAEDGYSVALTGLEGHTGEWIDVEAVIRYNDSDVTSVWTHAMVDTCEHEWEQEDEIPSTCTEKGSRTLRCTQCGGAKTEELPLADHTYSSAFTTDVPATCTAEGSQSRHCTRCGAKTDVKAIPEAPHAWDGGAVTTQPTCTAAGVKTYTCTVCGDKSKTESVGALGHDYSPAFTIDVPATCTAEGSQSRHCTRCGAKTDVMAIPVIAHKGGTATCLAQANCEVCGQAYGSKLQPVLKLTADSLKMRVKQSTTAFKVTEMAEGDSVVSVTSSNTKVLKVSSLDGIRGTFKLKAQKKTGKAKLTVTLASGLSQTITVTVQKGTVKTTAIGGLESSLRLDKGNKVTLKPILAPVTSQQKVTYKSSNKKIVTVSSKGVIKAVKPGKATITVKSGKKSKKITVIVNPILTTDITRVPAAVSVKKGKKLTLKPKLIPSNSSEGIKYTTSNKKVATVSSKGVIKGVSKGTAVITVTSGSRKVTCTVEVK